jgi:hypothetical protein
MDKHDDNGVIWLHLICCGGALLAFVVISLAPTLIAFVLTYKMWLLVAGLGLALAGGLVWLRRVRRAARINPASRPNQIEPAGVREP